MKYIAFENTYNEQIYDSVTRAVTWTREDRKIEDVGISEDDPLWRGRAMSAQVAKQFCLADKGRLERFFSLLILWGDACPQCGYGTRKTSKNWRRCKRETCGERIHMITVAPEDRKQYLRDARKAGAAI